MADNYTRLADTISSSEGKAFITINGQNRELFELQSIRAQLDMIVQERRILGHRMTQHKVVGATGSGSTTMYFMNSQHLNEALKYIKTGSRTPIKVQLRNEDTQSTVGKQEVVLGNIIFSTVPVAAIEESDDPITFDTDFTFDDLENLESFVLPENYR
ncbi:MAG: phage tail tube protein [Desulfitobacterium sp.]